MDDLTTPPTDRWNGVWTADLLRDLCGGVTRAEGSFKARTFHRERALFTPWGTVQVERKDKMYYQIAGEGWRLDVATVDRLNALHAVPLYDDGREWKVRRPDPAELVANCPECGGAGETTCGNCNGSGECDCHCGHEHDCHECDGLGKVECEECQTAATGGSK